MSKANNWYVITGGPSSGKTTLLAALEAAGYKTVPEAARTLIDQALARGISVQQLRADEKKFQENVAKLKGRIELELPSELPVFFDRGMHDTLAYMRHYGFTLEQWLRDLHEAARYRTVFLLDQLPEYQSDYARVEGKQFVDSITQLLHEAYSEYGMKPIRVPALPVSERKTFILKHMEES